MNNIICHTNSYNIGTGFLIKGIIDKDLISIPISDLNDKMNVGWIKRKNVEFILKLAKEFPNFKFKIGGKGPEKKN